MNNSYTSINEFKQEYSGKRDPANEKWYGLEFMFANKYYRFEYIKDQISLFEINITKDCQYPDIKSYNLINTFSNIDDALKYVITDGVILEEMILDENTVFLGQD